MAFAARWLVTAAVLLVLGIGFFALYASLHVRSAIGEGALDMPACITPRDRERLDRGEYQRLADWWVLRSVQLSDGANPRGFAWHMRGLVADFGMRLSYSSEERQALAIPALRRLRTCHVRKEPE